MGAIKLSFVMLMRWLWDCTCGGRLIAWRTNLVVRGKELSVLPFLSLGRGEGLEVESVTNCKWFNQLCLCNEASVKTQKDSVPRVFRLVSTWRIGESGVLREDMAALSLSPIPFPMPLLSCFWVMSFYDKSVIYWVKCFWERWATLAN